MKIRVSIIYKLAILIVPLIFVQCKTSFYCLPNNLVDSKNISGVYENESILSPFGNQDLWHCIKRWSKIENDGHLVRLHMEKNAIYAQLIKDNEIVERKKIKGTLTSTCFIAKKRYFIIPILPNLWFYYNQQIRISARDNSLIIDEFNVNGGFLIMMVGGSRWVTSYEYRKMDEKDTTKQSPGSIL